MVEPTPEQLDLLTPTERAAYRFSDFFNRRLKFLSVMWINTMMRVVLWFTAGNRLRIHGREHLDSLDDPRLSAIMANLQLFDFFVVAYMRPAHAVYETSLLPVRSILLRGPTGIAINMATTGMAMFPPIFRGQEKGGFNQYAIERIAHELRTHPPSSNPSGRPSEQGPGPVLADGTPVEGRTDRAGLPRRPRQPMYVKR